MLLGCASISNLSVRNGRELLGVLDKVLDRLLAGFTYSSWNIENNPKKSIREIFQILKTHSDLFLQTNFLYPEHGGPEDFYRFTVYGLNEMVHRSGFEVKNIEKIGNRFTLI
jgi:hypothetical protein